MLHPAAGRRRDAREEVRSCGSPTTMPCHTPIVSLSAQSLPQLWTIPPNCYCAACRQRQRLLTSSNGRWHLGRRSGVDIDRGRDPNRFCLGEIDATTAQPLTLLDVWAKAREWHKGTNGPIAAHSRCTLCHRRFSLWRISQAHALNHRLCVPKGVPLPLHRQIWTSARSLTCGRDSSRSIWC
jgi:hypothetical protein